MGLADSDAERIRSVVGSGDGVEVEEDFNHLLHLFLVGLAIACDGHLRLGGAEFADGHSGLFGGEGEYAAGLGDGNTCGDVLLEEEFLNGDGIGLMQFE